MNSPKLCGCGLALHSRYVGLFGVVYSCQHCDQICRVASSCNLCAKLTRSARA